MTDRITTSYSSRYLGVIIGHNRSFNHHIQHLASKNFDLFSRLRSTLGIDWGSSRQDALALYRLIFVPRISYASRFWQQAVHSRKARQTSSTLQRRALLGISSAYRTSATSSLQVITGNPPLDLEIQHQACLLRPAPSPLRNATSSAAPRTRDSSIPGSKGGPRVPPVAGHTGSSPTSPPVSSPPFLRNMCKIRQSNDSTN